MPTFLLIERHSPENCPMYNVKARKAALKVTDKIERLLKKHRVKMVGRWVVHSEHLAIGVYEASRLEAFQKLGMEPEIVAMGAFNTSEMKLAVPIKEVMKMLRKAK